MKYTLLALALFATASHAGNYGQGGNALTQSQSQSAYGGGGDTRNTLVIAPPAIAPSQSINTICQIATPQSSGFNVGWGLIGTSKTSGVVYNDVCYALERKQYEVADRLMCIKSADYAKANKACN